jgi:hypothetical protein
MEVFETTGGRMDAALDLLASGQSLAFSGIEFRLVGPDAVECSVESTWQIENVTEATARADIASAYRTMQYLQVTSQRFRELTHGRRVQTVLFHGYGMGGVNLCTESGGALTWTAGLPKHR